MQAGIALIQNKYPEVKISEKTTMEMVEDLKEEMGDVVYRRNRFVVGEISKFKIGKISRKNDFENVGKLMTTTLQSL